MGRVHGGGAVSLSPTQRRVLQLLYEGAYAASIAQRLKLTRQAVTYHVRRLEAAGYIRENHAETSFQRRTLGGPTTLKVFGLTEAGLRALQEEPRQGPLTPASPGVTEAVKDVPLLNRAPREPRVEVHNFEVKVPVKKLGIAWLPNAAEMQNWTRRWDPDFHGVYLEVTTQHILLKAAAEGADRAIAEGLCLRRLLRVMELLERQYGCELGRPEFRCIYAPGRTKIGVMDHPLAKGLQAHRGRLADVDGTPEPGTLHPHDPADADRVVHIARNSEEAVFLLRGLAEQQTAFLAGLTRLLRPETVKTAPAPPGMEVH